MISPKHLEKRPAACLRAGSKSYTTSEKPRPGIASNLACAYGTEWFPKFEAWASCVEGVDLIQKGNWTGVMSVLRFPLRYEEVSVPDDQYNLDYSKISAALVQAYLANNSLPSNEVAGFFSIVHNAIQGLGKKIAPKSSTGSLELRYKALSPPDRKAIKKSVKPDGLVSFIDGKTYKTLKRHLTKHGLNPDRYRQQYGLPADYPMVAPLYSAQRSQLAKVIGLGRIVEGTQRVRSSKRSETVHN